MALAEADGFQGVGQRLTRLERLWKYGKVKGGGIRQTSGPPPEKKQKRLKDRPPAKRAENGVDRIVHKELPNLYQNGQRAALTVFKVSVGWRDWEILVAIQGRAGWYPSSRHV